MTAMHTIAHLNKPTKDIINDSYLQTESGAQASRNGMQYVKEVREDEYPVVIAVH
jgi:hypothetical protein